MELEFNYISWILFCNFLIAAGIAVYSYLKDLSKSHIYFTYMMLAIAEWSVAAAFESAAQGIEAKIIWSKIEYIGASFTAVFFLKYAFGFSKIRSQWFLKNFWVFRVIPIIVILLVFTNEWHHLIWIDFSWSDAGNNILNYIHGPAFSLMVAYSLGLVLTGLIFILTSLSYMPSAFRSQANFVMIASVFPFLATLSYSLGFSPLEGLDITVISFMVTGLVFLIGISRYRIFNILPLARHQITEIMQDGVVITDNEYKILFYNPAAKKLLKIDIDFHFTDLKKIDWLFSYCSRPENDSNKEVEIQAGEHSNIWYSIVRSRISGKNDKLSGNLIVIRDITRRKTLETETRNLIAELHNTQVELVELNSQKDKLLSIIAHDLRTPFHQILSFARMLAEDIDIFSREEIHDMTQGILQAGGQGAEILEDLLAWARTQRNSTEVTPSKISPASLLEEIIPVFELTARDKNLSIRIAGELDTLVVANRNVISIVFRNLIANAVKFSKPGSEIILNIVRGTDFHSVEVIDFGIGIPEDDLPKLFNIDIKYTRTGTTGESGTGLGLILCKDLINRSKGEISVKSIQGKGSTFTVKLPAFREPSLN